jgi:hypothetical protein
MASHQHGRIIRQAQRHSRQLGRHRRALVVDVTDNRSTIRAYIDAHQYVQAHSTLAADTPARRLETLASCLGLNWPSVTRRCAQLAEYGLAGMVEPRSRLLSLAGADRACGFLGDLQTPSR